MHVNLVKHLPKAHWSASLKSWYIINNPENLKLIYAVFKNHAYVDGSQLFNKPITKTEKTPIKNDLVLSQENRDLLNNFYEYLKGKRYSKSTIETYSFF